MEFVGGMLLLWALFFALEIGLVIYALVDLARTPMDTAMKLLWVLVIVFFPILGSIASLIINHRSPRTAL